MLLCVSVLASVRGRLVCEVLDREFCCVMRSCRLFAAFRILFRCACPSFYSTEFGLGFVKNPENFGILDWDCKLFLSDLAVSACSCTGFGFGLKKIIKK